MEINAYVNRINNTRKRADRNKVLPHGPPNDIFTSPERYGCLDFKVSIMIRLGDNSWHNTNLFKVKVQPEAFQYVREQFAPPSDPVFELVPPVFAQCAGQVYAQIGSPQLNPANIWHVYREMVETLNNMTNSDGANANQDCIDAVDEWQVTESLQDLNREPDISYPLIEGRELLGGIEQDDGSFYLGGVNGGQGLGT